MSLYSIALSGLNASQIALGSTGNNITNINTPGYNREVTTLSSNPAGGGVKVSSVERQFNAFVTTQYNQANSILAGLSNYQSQISQIDSLMADSKSGLAVMMQGFFTSLQDLSASPADPAARQGVLGTAENLAAQFRSMDLYLSDLGTSADGEVKSQIIQINTLSESIAHLNREISLAKAKTGDSPNALMNERDYLVEQLSQRVNISVNIQDGGTYNISFANGLSLVAGFNSSSLEAVASSANPTQVAVGYRDGGNNLIELRDSTIKSGELGGAIQFRNEALSSAQSRLGQLAVGLTLSLNEIHAAGVDLNGDAGEAFFSVGNPKSFSHANNTGTADLAGTFEDASLLGLGDYDISYSAVSGFSVTNKLSGENTATFPVGTTTLAFGGMEFTLSGVPNDGDRFLIKPFQNATSSLKTEITNVVKIAAGIPAGGTGSGDNRNALAMMNLQSKQVLEGKSSLNQGYSAMVTDIGNRSQVISVKLSTQLGLTEQLRAVQQGISGVNLDEEASNLLRYQQHYQASAKIVETATTIMDTILSIRN